LLASEVRQRRLQRLAEWSGPVPRAYTTDDLEPVPSWIRERVACRRGRERHPETSVDTRLDTGEPLPRHADDLESLAPERERAADHARVGAEAPDSFTGGQEPAEET
jgi:hypothetical protein